MADQTNVPIRVIKNEQATVLGPTQQLVRAFRTTFMVGAPGDEDGPFTVDTYMHEFDPQTHRKKIEQVATDTYRVRHGV